jgi:hypothetical protein
VVDAKPQISHAPNPSGHSPSIKDVISLNNYVIIKISNKLNSNVKILK